MNPLKHSQNLAAYGGEFSLKSTHESFCYGEKWNREEKVGENRRENKDEEENMKNLRWNVMRMKERWVNLKDFEWITEKPPCFHSNAA